MTKLPEMQCPYCGRKFTPRTTAYKFTDINFCSKTCYNNYKKEFNELTRLAFWGLDIKDMRASIDYHNKVARLCIVIDELLEYFKHLKEQLDIDEIRKDPRFKRIEGLFGE